MNILNSERIGLMQSAATAQEAIRIAGEYLIQAGYVEERYVDAMLNNFKTNGPYFAMAPNFAMPHARPEDGVLQSGIALITLKTPVNFNTPNDPVKVIIALASKNDDEHLEYMSKIAMILGKKGIIEELYQCRQPEDIIGLTI